LGSFIVRSGILNSVHSFASDPSRGVFLLSLFAIFAFSSLGLFFSKSVLLKSEWPELMSKQYLLLLNNIVLLVILLIVFLGTLYPIVTEVFYEQKLSIGPDYFSSLISPLVFVLIGLFLIEQFLSNLKANKKNTLLLLGFFALIFLVLFITELSPINLSLLFVFLVLLILLTRGISRARATTKDIKIMHKVLGHLSVVILTLAVLANHEYSESIDVKLKPGDQVEFSGSTLKLNSINIEGKENFDTVVARFSVNETSNEKRPDI
jgi:cytochrome c-type biogenesis protein CcmF